MWWRVLLLVIVLACTFQREINAEPNDVICVLILSGLQKEDLDVNLVKKLQRHNVNIDNLNNENVIERCILHASSEKPAKNLTPSFERTGPMKSDRQEQTSSAQIRKLIYDFTDTDKSKEYDTSTNEYIETERRTTVDNLPKTNKDAILGNFVNLLKLWTQIKDDEKKAIQITKYNLTVPITLSKHVNVDPQPKDMSYITEMLLSYVATKRAEDATTMKPISTTKKLNDIITQKIKSYLENNYDAAAIQHVLAEFTENGTANLQNSKDDEQSLKKGSINYIHDLLNKKDQANTSQTEISLSSRRQDVTQANVKNNTKKPFPDTIIKEITESVKASLLKDLQKQMSSTTLATTTIVYARANTNNTPKTAQNATTVLESLKVLLQQLKKNNNLETKTELTPPSTMLQITQDKLNNATNALENFMKLFQQLKNVTDVIAAPANVRYKLTQTKTTNAMNPRLMPVDFGYDAKAQGVKVPVYMDPYRPIIQVHHPVVLKSNVAHQIVKEKIYIQKRFDNLSDFNLFPVINIGSKIAERPAVISIIQTDAVEVPPLGIPVPDTVKALNQNIIVTTKHPMDHFREEYYTKHRNSPIGFNRYRDYEVSDGRYYDTDSKRPSDGDSGRSHYSDTDTENRYSDFGRSYARGYTNVQRDRHAAPQKSSERLQDLTRNRQGSDSDDFYKEYLSIIKPPGLKSYHSVYPRDRNKERFHEKLERSSEWRSHFQRENKPKHDKRLSVNSRAQLGLKDLKKKARENDAHFENFLKTQKKVNDMLEQILATGLPDRVRSVETPETVHAYRH